MVDYKDRLKIIKGEKQSLMQQNKELRQELRNHQIKDYPTRLHSDKKTKSKKRRGSVDFDLQKNNRNYSQSKQ